MGAATAEDDDDKVDNHEALGLTFIPLKWQGDNRRALQQNRPCTSYQHFMRLSSYRQRSHFIISIMFKPVVLSDRSSFFVILATFSEVRFLIAMFSNTVSAPVAH